MKIENEYILKNILTNGINIFAGAGFSRLCKHNENYLPTENELLEEVKRKFPTVKEFDTLPDVSEILNKENPDEYQEFLRERMTVTWFDKKYLNLKKVKIKSIITTNIDDLFYKIFDGPEACINDLTYYGRLLIKEEIPYIPLHGSIKSPKNLIFSKSEIASAYSNNVRTFSIPIGYMSTYPILILGYGMHDPDIDQLFSIIGKKNPEDIWILTNEGKKEVFYTRLGYRTINCDIEMFLDWIGTNCKDVPLETPYTQTPNEFDGYLVPKIENLQEVVSCEDFHQKGITNWYSVLSKDAYERAFTTDIYNEILKNDPKQNIVILGSALSGKTTLLMTLASKDYGKKIKYFFNSINIQTAQLFLKKIGAQNSIVFIDNMMNDIEAIQALADRESIQIVGTSDDYIYEIIKHKTSCFMQKRIPDISEIEKIQLRRSIPTHLLKENRIKQNPQYKRNSQATSFLEFNNENIKNSLTKEHLLKFYNKLKHERLDIFELLEISTYLEHNSSILSSDIICLYFDTKSYFELIDTTKSYLLEINNKIVKSTQSYFSIRSSTFLYLSNLIFRHNFTHDYGEAIKKLLEIHPTSFPMLPQFRRRAFDAGLFYEIFRGDAIPIYDKLENTDFDSSKYILQQKALCFLKLGNTSEAFSCIEKALHLSPKNQSLRNTHAVILFEANKNSKLNIAIDSMKKAMNLLQVCYNTDTRKKYHAKKFAEYSLFLEKTYGILDYKQEAKKWLMEENKKNPDKKIANLLNKFL